MRTILLFLIFFCIFSVLYAEPSKDLLTNAILKRLNEEDPFNLLTEEQLQREWSADSSENLVQSAQSLRHSFQDVSYLEIVLVSDRDTNLYAELKESLEDEVYEFPLTAFENENNELHISKKYFVTVSKGDKQLVNEMSNTIKGYLVSDNHMISSKSIDNILLNYYDSNDLTLKMYILDLKVSVGHSYSILSDTMLDCSTSYSLGSKSFIYLDLHATCSKFGPKTIGEGQVLPNLIPSLSPNNNNNNSLLVQLQNFIHHSIHYMLSPSLAYYPLNLFNTLQINIIIIKDHSSTPYNLDSTIESLKSKLNSIPLLRGQKNIEFTTFTYTTLDCDHCASVLSHSMKHYQSPTPSFTEFHLNHKSYLDSKELHYWLSHFNSFFVPQSKNDVTILPIYILSLSQYTNSPPLLDKKQQAVSFEDMIVAVHSDSPSYYLDYICNTHIVSVDPSKLEVPIVSAAIQSIWGIPASYKSWNLVHNKSIENYIWALHPYSIGSPFINSIQIHPLLKDIALRNLLYTNLHSALDEVNHLFSHFEEYDKEVSEVLSSSELVQFVRRWNLFQFKVENAKKYLSLNNYNSSLAFINSLEYDIVSLHNLIHSAGNKLYTYLYCEEDKTLSTTTFSLVNFIKILIVMSPILVMIYVFVSFSKAILFVHSSK